MGSAYTSKHELLQKFTKIMFEHNPMQLKLDGNPNADNEYESEALSVLSRFNEGALHLCEDETLQRELAVGIVQQAFEFWFNDPNMHEPEKLSFLLLETYKASYPQPEQTVQSEVPSGT